MRKSPRLTAKKLIFMLPLDQQYKDALDQIAEAIQASPSLAKYLDEEEEEDYLALRAEFEPKIAEVHEAVAANNPLQLVSMEQYLLDDKFEGLFLPRILGYAVLRGEVDDQYRYVRPQPHFKDVLLSICNSSNFDSIKKRMGQTIQTGFALSSDIWITSLINEITNKRIRYFLQGLKDPRFRNEKERRILYLRYKNQFKNENYYSAKFPSTLSELKVEFSSLKLFLIQRISAGNDNASLAPEIVKFLDNPAFKDTDEYIELLSIYGSFMDIPAANQDHFAAALNEARKNVADFDEKWMQHLLFLHDSRLPLNAAADKRIYESLDKNIDDQLTELYKLTDTIHTMGYTNPEAVEAVRVAYGQHEGVSTFNTVTRKTIFTYINQLISNLLPSQYPDFIELAKIFPTYMDIFSNQQFNQDVKDICMVYVKKLLKKFTDKRGKDYQDIKKFVTATFSDLGFLTDKQIVELFKTRRKKKKPA